MSLEKIFPTTSSFTFDPTINDLIIFTDIQFDFNFKTQQFEVDQNPVGQPMLTPISDISVNEELTFHAKFRNQETDFVIQPTHAVEKILLELFSTINNNGFKITEQDIDKFKLVFREGKLESIRIWKNSSSSELLDAVNFKLQDGKYYIIKQSPWRKIEIEKITTEGNNLLFNGATETITFQLETQPLIFETVQKLIEASF
jgi:hypothetical protein